MNPLPMLARLADFAGTRALMWFALGALVIAAVAALGGVRATTTLPAAHIAPELGRAFIVRPAVSRWLVIPAGDWLGRMQGAARLYEDGRELGPGRQLHQSIRDEAKGLFAVDRGYLRFAASDGSDPRSNGRVYTLDTAVNPGVIPWLVILVGIAIALTRFLASSTGSDVAPAVRRLRPMTAVASVALGAAAMVALLMTAGRLAIEIRSPPLVAVCLVMLGLLLVLPVLWPALRHTPGSAPASQRHLHQALWACAALGSAMLVYGAVFATGLITIQNRIDSRTIGPGGGKMYVAVLPAPPLGLGYQEFWRNPLVTPTRIAEDGREIGLGNSVHAWIVERGGGRFSIFNGNLLFSTPDNSDPRTNGRRYDVTTPLLPTSQLFLMAFVLIGGSLFGLRQFSARAVGPPAAARRAHCLAMIAAFLLTVCAAAALWRSRPDLYPDHPLGGIALWFAPLVVVAVVLGAIWRQCSQPVNVRTAISAVAAFSTTTILTLACLTPLLDNLLLADAISSVRYDGSQVLSTIHANDSATYIASATLIAEIGQMDGVGANRPINASMLAHAFWSSDANGLMMLFLRAAFMALAIVIASYETAKTFGWGAAFVVGAFSALFAAEFVPSAMSEPNGLAWACLGMAISLRALRTHSLWLFAAGTGLATVAMMTRPGAMLVLLALIAFAWWERNHFKVSGTRALVISLAAVAVAWQLSTYLNWSLNAPTWAALSNFPLVFYGLASGGKGWQQASIDRPDLVTPSELTAAAIQNIWLDPSLILNFLWREFLEFWPFSFQLTKVDLFFALTILGIAAALATLRSIYSRLIVILTGAVWLSAPIIMNDGGYRVFAASVPFMALMAAWPLTVLRGIPATAPSDQQQLDGRNQTCIHTLFCMTGISGVIAIVSIVALIFTPLIFRRPAPEIMNRKLPSSCAIGEASIVVHGSATTQTLSIIPDQEPRSVVPNVRESAFLRHMMVNAPAILTELGRVSAPASVVQIVEGRPDGHDTKIHLVFFLDHFEGFPRDQTVEICATHLKAKFNDFFNVSRAIRVINIHDR